MALDAGFNFRSTSGYVTDGAGQTYVLKTDSYPTTRDTFTFGWDAAPSNDRDRDATADVRLAGINYQANASPEAVLRVDLDATGDHDIHLACGDTASAQYDQYVQFRDGTTAFATIDKTETIAQDNYYDATGTKYSEANWPGSETAISHTFSSTILRVAVSRDSSGSSNSVITHLRVVETGGGGATVVKGSHSLMGVGI